MFAAFKTFSGWRARLWQNICRKASCCTRSWRGRKNSVSTEKTLFACQNQTLLDGEKHLWSWEAFYLYLWCTNPTGHLTLLSYPQMSMHSYLALAHRWAFRRSWTWESNGNWWLQILVMDEEQKLDKPQNSPQSTLPPSKFITLGGYLSPLRYLASFHVFTLHLHTVTLVSHRNLPSPSVMKKLDDPPERVKPQFIVNGVFQICEFFDVPRMRVFHGPFRLTPCKEPSDWPCNALLGLHGLDIPIFRG